jgi:signal peptidase II
MARFWSLSLLISGLIIVDQLTKGAIQQSFSYGETKVIIEGFFSLAYVKNTGAAFGFGADGHIIFRQIVFLALPVVFCGWVFYMLVKTLKGPFYMSLAYALILAGATGNLIDRFSLGYVVDFLMFYWKDESHHFPAFNVADSCITIAGFLLVLDFFIQLKHKKEKKDAADSLPN